MITINGQPVKNVERITLQEYLVKEGYIPSCVAVECNGEILPKDAYDRKQLQDGDLLEIIHFVGGG